MQQQQYGNHQRGGYQGGRYQSRGGGRSSDRGNAPQTFRSESFKDYARGVFGCEANEIYPFSETDPFNSSNMVDGIHCSTNGSLLLTHVNGIQLPEVQIVWGTPNMSSVLKRHARKGDKSLEDWVEEILVPAKESSEPAETFFFHFATKWNGANIQFFKYRDANGATFVSAKPRGSPFVRNSRHNPGESYLALTKEALELHSALVRSTPTPTPTPTAPESPIPEAPVASESPETSGKTSSYAEAIAAQSTSSPSLPSARPSFADKPQLDSSSPFFTPLKQKDVQSMTLELVGYKCPHLVRYEFSIDLKPLFVTAWNGDITPIGVMDKASEHSSLQRLTSKEELLELCSASVDADLETNRRFRVERGLPVEGRYWFGHFQTEGKVVYLLKGDQNSQGVRTIDRRCMFKVKPQDIARRHWEEFDTNAMACILEGLEKLYSKDNAKLTEAGLAREMDLNQFSWPKYSKKIMEFAAAVPRRPQPPISDDAKQQQIVLLTVGYPGCGKSTFANKLIRDGKRWTRVNQDELGSRGAVERALEVALRSGKNVIVDRTNFDIPQRHSWIAMAARFKVSRIEAVEFRIPAGVCKKRVSEREDHPTIPKGDSGIAIVDKFVAMMQWPRRIEGLDHIWSVTCDAEADALVDQLNPPTPPSSPKGSDRGESQTPESSTTEEASDPTTSNETDTPVPAEEKEHKDGHHTPPPAE